MAFLPFESEYWAARTKSRKWSTLVVGLEVAQIAVRGESNVVNFSLLGNQNILG